MNLKEIAKLANVSPSTVSLVLHNREGVSPRKRQEIIRILENNGYRSNNLSDDKKTKNIRFIKYKKHAMLVDGNPGFINAIIDAIEKECRRLGYNLIMTTYNEKHLNEMTELIEHDCVDGFLLLGTELSAEDMVYVSNPSVPMLVIDNYLPMLEYNCITMNNKESIFRAVSHLSYLGHPKIGFIANMYPSSNCNARREAYEQALTQLGYAFDLSQVYTVHPTPDGAYQSIRTLLEEGVNFPSALVANNDTIALGAMKAFKEFSIRVPEDISIIGFDSIPFSTFSDPPLTTTEVSCIDMGILAVRLLHDRIQHPFSSITKIEMGTKLIERNSTMPFHP